MTTLYLPNKHLDAVNGLPVIKSEIQSWLNEHAPGWTTNQLGGILWVILKDEHVALALNTHAWNVQS